MICYNFWVPYEIESCNFQNLFVFRFPETSQNLISFRQLLFLLFQREKSENPRNLPKWPLPVAKMIWSFASLKLENVRSKVCAEFFYQFIISLKLEYIHSLFIAFTRLCNSYQGPRSIIHCLLNLHYLLREVFASEEKLHIGFLWNGTIVRGFILKEFLCRSSRGCLEHFLFLREPWLYQQRKYKNKVTLPVVGF